MRNALTGNASGVLLKTYVEQILDCFLHKISSAVEVGVVTRERNTVCEQKVFITHNERSYGIPILKVAQVGLVRKIKSACTSNTEEFRHAVIIGGLDSLRTELKKKLDPCCPTGMQLESESKIASTTPSASAFDELPHGLALLVIRRKHPEQVGGHTALLGECVQSE